MNCSAESCNRKAVCRGMCNKHYRQWFYRNNPIKCSIPGCDTPSYRSGMCQMHGRRVRLYGDPNVRLIAPAGSGWVREGGYKQLGGTSEHTIIAEKILGRPIPKGAEVHHVNENKSDNRNSNLVICPDSSYHKLLHVRTRAYDACGHADWKKCSFCKKYDDKKNLVLIPGKRQEYSQIYHRECRNKSRRIDKT